LINCLKLFIEIARHSMAQALAQTSAGRRRARKFFGKAREAAVMPNLIEVQKASYDQFLMVEEPKGGRPDEHPCLSS
jgi:DNA-directed RNA polymerase subunit beta